MADRTFDVLLTRFEVDKLDAFKRHFIHTSEIPSPQQLTELWGVGKTRVTMVLKRFCEAGILRHDPAGKLEFGRRPYRVVNCGRYVASREQQI